VNYYERHLGDYARDTAHLSMLEHGAYGLLLDRYYSTEAGIPADQAHRLARARSKDERAAVDAVLGEFFTLLDGVWINGRAEREVERAQTKIKAARENGKAGGRPKKNPETSEQKPTGLLLGSDLETELKAHQIPDTRHQKTKTPQPPEKSGGDDPAGFAEFWNSWPASARKQDRKKCAEKWRRSKFGANLPAIVAHVEAAKQSKQWRDGFEPAPLTYLNGERWADGAPVEAETAGMYGEFL
jgi:uncharacterized protein YdaU (DUF1376 family)